MHPRALLLLAGLLCATSALGADDSLIRSVCLRRQYLRAHPAEEAIVLTEDGPERSVTASVALTVGGTLEVDDGARSPIAGVEAEVINHPDRLRSAIASAPHRRFSQAPWSVAEASARLWAVGTASECFPAAKGRPERLVFDWEGRHITYSPRLGCSFEEPASEPLTGHAEVVGPRASVVDALVFVQRYRAAWASERAVLVLPERIRDGSPLPGGAAFSRGGRLGLYSSAFGAWEVADQSAAALSDSRLLRTLLAGALRKASHSADPQRWLALPSINPVSFADDSPRLALYRLRDALQAAEIPAMVNESVRGRDGAPDPAASRLVFEWDGLQFGYLPSRGAYGKGPVPAAVRTSLLDDLLFLQGYAASHPSERTALLVHPPSAAEADRRRVADALYTQAGHVRLHSLLAGDLAVDSLRPEDFADPERLQAAASRAFAEAFARHPKPLAADSQPLSLEEAQQRLVAAGIRAAQTPLRRRREDGSLEPVAGGAVRFSWNGKLYLYLANACYAQGASGADIL